MLPHLIQLSQGVWAKLQMYRRPTSHIVFLRWHRGPQPQHQNKCFPIQPFSPVSNKAFNFPTKTKPPLQFGYICVCWWDFFSWVKEDRVIHCRPIDNFLQHHPLAGSKRSNRRWKMWWIAVTNTIWKFRNELIFHNQPFDISKLADSTLFLMWTWLWGWERDFKVPFQWWSSAMPLVFN